MAEYTYKDVIIDPEDPRVEIGKEYYFSNNPSVCISKTNSNGFYDRLYDIDVEDDYPFRTENCGRFACIIRKKEPSYAERQEKWIKENDLEVGDLVRVTREAEDNEGGWDCYWAPRMTALVGSVLKVKKIDEESGIVIPTENGDLFFPYFVLEKVEQKYVPFDLSNEEDRARLRGAWVRYKESEREHAVTAIFLDERPPFVELNDHGFTAEEFFEYFEFLDGTPCGKLEDEE